MILWSKTIILQGDLFRTDLEEAETEEELAEEELRHSRVLVKKCAFELPD